jgi:hypothetical protein
MRKDVDIVVIFVFLCGGKKRTHGGGIASLYRQRVMYGPCT